MGITLLPKTRLGWWSIGLFIAWVACFALADALVGPGPAHNVAYAYSLILSAIGTASFITGLIGIIKNKERSILVFLSTFIGLYNLISGIMVLLGLPQ